MLVGPIVGPGFAKALVQIEKGNALCDAVELRLDRIGSLSSEEIEALLRAANVKTILTHPNRGSKYLSFAPDYLSLSWDEPLVTPLPRTQIIREYHNFNETPENLEAIYQKIPAGDIIKMATFANETTDALRMLLFSKGKKNFAGICMGPLGIATRILGPLVKSALQFASLGTESAPGQLPIEELLETYHFRSLTPKTVPFALIGNPVSGSVSHLTHNARFRNEGIDGVYLKLQLEEKELPRFFSLAKELGFRGISVTRPFKEKVAPFVDEVEERAEQIGAINTLTFLEGRLLGANTDAEGALHAVEDKIPVKGKKVLLLGTGGSAKAIGFEAIARGAHLTTLSRDLERAKQFAAAIGGEYGTYGQIPDYDIVINTAPVPNPFPSNQLLPQKVVMDITNTHAESEWMLEASRIGCLLLYGIDMFERQAIGQFDRWINLRCKTFS